MKFVSCGSSFKNLIISSEIGGASLFLRASFIASIRGSYDGLPPCNSDNFLNRLISTADSVRLSFL